MPGLRSPCAAPSSKDVSGSRTFAGEGILFDVYDAADLKDKTTVIVKSLRADWALEKELIKKLKTNLARQRGKMVPDTPIISCESILSDESVRLPPARTYSVGPSLSKRLEMGAAFNAELHHERREGPRGLIKRLHAEGWVHGGLHGGNIFSDGKQNVVTDLGVAETSLLPPVLISDQRLKYLPQESPASRALPSRRTICTPGAR
ncbi:MAG: hypothetical protein U0166_06065 [Acidobacteriota bacterium]